jgi:molybdopterin-containing oxidoreductase family membrane subunit
MSSVSTDERVSEGRLGLWLSPWIVLVAVGLWAAFLCLRYGLNQTNMDNRYAFGLWIFVDLTVIALGAAAFTSGFLAFVLGRDELRPLVPSAVVVGFACYSGAVGILAIDVGQPLRAWFTFWHPNVHSMLTEVTFCITCYLMVLALEYTPLLFGRSERSARSFTGRFGRELHHRIGILAGIGALLSFFHQGSLGGLYGVLRGRPFAFREGWAIWPSTFFLFVLSAVAVGPIFLLAITRVVEWLHGKPLVPPETGRFVSRLSGRLLVLYVLAKAVDSLVWINHTTPAMGVHAYDFYTRPPFGTWVLMLEIVGLGLLPALVLLWPRTRAHAAWQVAAAIFASAGIALNRFVMTVQTLALPTLPFDELWLYVPSWQEVASFAAVVGYAVVLYTLSFRYLPLFPGARRLHP